MRKSERRTPRIGAWLFVLMKRIYARPQMWAVLLLIPIFGFAVCFTAGMESGALTVAVASKDATQPVYQEMLEKMDSRVMRFVVCGTPEEALRQVRSARADVAWVFSDDITGALRKAAREDSEDDWETESPVVEIYERFDNVFLKLSREKLFTILYPALSYEVYGAFIYEDLSIADISEAELRDNYGLKATDGSIIVFDLIEGSEGEADGKGYQALEISYLLSPARGLLSILLVMAAFSAAMLLDQDEKDGLLLRIPPGIRPLLSLFYYLITLIPAAVLMLLVLMGTGLCVSLGREIGLMGLLLAALIPFADLLRQLLKRTKLLYLVIPVLLFAMLVYCPVFLNIRSVRPLQYLLPPFFYLHSVLSGSYLGLFILQAAVYLGTDLGLYLIRRR